MRRVLSISLLAFLAAAATAAQSLPERSDRIVDYKISVALDPATHVLTGRQTLTWRNPSTTDVVSELQFHLYLNAFKNTTSTFVKESGGQLRGDEMARDGWGWIDITSMATSAGADLKPTLTFIQPDDGNKEDQTVARVTLPEPVPPGGSVTLEMAFTSKLPQVFARTGYKDDFYLAGQWFPKLGVYEPAGMRGRETGGWNCHQFHATSEFYADFGTYAVDITVPSNYIVGATGERKRERANGDGTTTYTYEQADIHDFAWTADPDYVVVKAAFSATQDVSPAEYERTAKLLGRTLEEVKLSDVDITVLLQPDHQPQAQRHIDAAKAGLKYYGLRYGRYPFKTLTVVDPAPGAGGAGGMEYPTFITAGSAWLFNFWPFDKIRLVEEVTVHEFGHQFWYGMVGSNEFEEAWLDEGFNTWSTSKAMVAAYGADATIMEFLGFRMSDRDMSRASNDRAGRYNRILAKSWEYTPPSAYGFYSYYKPALALETLEGYLGEQTMARLMRTYHERFRFKHPRSEDFFAVVNEVTGQDWSWYFDQVIRGTDLVDYDIGSASTRAVQTAQGVFDAAAGRRTVSSRDADEKDLENERANKQIFESVVVVRRSGGVKLPVEVAFKFEGKPVERQTWDGRDTTRRFRFERPEKLEWVDVDPDRKIALDVNWLNNGRRLTPDSRPAASWTARWLFMLQNIITTLGLL